MYRKFLIFIFCLCAPCLARADDCLAYKLKPDIVIKKPVWQKSVVRPLKPMDLWHGNVVATLDWGFEIMIDTTYLEDGVCVGLRGVNGTIGYSDFVVKIDARHAPDTCAYNAILSHEDSHLRAYLSVIDDMESGIHDSVSVAADSIMPIFIPLSGGLNSGDMGADMPGDTDMMRAIDGALDTLNNQLQNHPDIILLRQKISAGEEIRNKKIDQTETNMYLNQCVL